MVTTVQQVLRPLLMMCFIMGLGTYPMTQSYLRIQWIVYLSILYRLTIWFSYAYLLYYTITLFKWKVLYKNTIFQVIEASHIIAAIICMIMSFYHQKVQLHFLFSCIYMKCTFKYYII